jgi:hypothetical protein
MRRVWHKRPSEILGCAQVQYYKRDTRVYCQINTVVLEKIFSFKKFISLVIVAWWEWLVVIMNMLKVEILEQLPFWNVYKEIVVDVIANRWMTISNDLKKVVMRKYSRKKCSVQAVLGQSISDYILFHLVS